MGDALRRILLVIQGQAVIIVSLLAILLFWQLQTVGFSIRTSLWDSLSFYFLSILSVLLMDVIQRFYNSKKAFNTSNTALLLLLITGTVFTNYWLVTSFHHPSDKHFNDYFDNSLGFRIVIISLVFAFIHLRFWSHRRHLREEQSKELAIAQQRDQVQIEINSIQQQLKPHFLFNSLNSINALTMTNPEEAQKMVQLLSEFMRGSIQQHQSELVSLEEEIRHLQLYTNIERVRFGDRLQVTYKIPEALLELKLPFLILQPIIENAIKYGLYGNTETITIIIAAEKVNNQLQIRVTNPFDEITQQTNKGTGFGIQSVERKLLLIYQRSNLLKTEAKNSIFTAIMLIPQK